VLRIVLLSARFTRSLQPGQRQVQVQWSRCGLCPAASCWLSLCARSARYVRPPGAAVCCGSSAVHRNGVQGGAIAGSWRHFDLAVLQRFDLLLACRTGLVRVDSVDHVNVFSSSLPSICLSICRFVGGRSGGCGFYTQR
jgi:hypothetical protein